MKWKAFFIIFKGLLLTKIKKFFGRYESNFKVCSFAVRMSYFYSAAFVLKLVFLSHFLNFNNSRKLVHWIGSSWFQIGNKACYISKVGNFSVEKGYLCYQIWKCYLWHVNFTDQNIMQNWRPEYSRSWNTKIKYTKG